MARGEQITKKDNLKIFKGGFGRFVERRFDWIALFIITLIILLTLVFF